MSFYEPLFYEAGVDMASSLRAGMLVPLHCPARCGTANATTAVGLPPALLTMSLAALQPLLRRPKHTCHAGAERARAQL